MSLETFPEIENFQKLPRKVIVKGGDPSIDDNQNTRLSGLVINNSGNGIRDVVVHVVLFDENKIPVFSLSAPADPEVLAQGGIGSFTFRFKEKSRKIVNYHLYSDWRFDE